MHKFHQYFRNHQPIFPIMHLLIFFKSSRRQTSEKFKVQNTALMKNSTAHHALPFLFTIRDRCGHSVFVPCPFRAVPFRSVPCRSVSVPCRSVSVPCPFRAARNGHGIRFETLLCPFRSYSVPFRAVPCRSVPFPAVPCPFRHRSATIPAPLSLPQGRLVDYVGRRVRVSGTDDRLGLDLASYSLVVSPVRAEDSGTYSCFFNNQADQRLVELSVLGEEDLGIKALQMHDKERT